MTEWVYRTARERLTTYATMAIAAASTYYNVLLGSFMPEQTTVEPIADANAA